MGAIFIFSSGGLVFDFVNGIGRADKASPQESFSLLAKEKVSNKHFFFDAKTIRGKNS